MEVLDFLDSPDIKKIHFVGIGGSSMSGLAAILMSQGYLVSGSDMKASQATEKLEKMGVQIYIGHNEDNIQNSDLVVYTVAVKESNPELAKARRLNIPVIDRASLLGKLMKGYPYSIAISGTHGKTTTTSMITMIMLEAGKDPTVHIGGELSTIGGNTKVGSNKYFITEACEYYESFLKFTPFVAVILNIELDHVDYFKDIEHVKETFCKFASIVPRDGYIVACVDDENVQELLNRVYCNKITYGLKPENAMWSAKDIIYDDKGCASYTLLLNRESLGTIKLEVPGIHNVSNSLASIAACHTMGCDMRALKDGLVAFTGTHRRFETKGVVDNIRVVDDYAHHPSEVKATLKAARYGVESKIWCVFQPHTYTRTKSLINEFSTAFIDADTVILADIYAAREADPGDINSGMLAERLREKGQKAVYIKGFESINDYLKKNAAPGDLIITMGAGDIYKVGEMFLMK